MALLSERNDLHLTSTGVGHSYNESPPFPPTGFQRTALDPLPPQLQEKDPCSYFSTTTGTYHNYKPNNTVLSNAIHKKAAGHWKVGYVEDVIKKLQVQPWRKPLTMGNQNSEMKSQFTAREGIPMSRHFSSDLQPPKFRHHNNEGPLKSLVRSTQNKELKGEKYLVPERGVLSYHGDMYLTTTQKDHRAFTKVELEKYPKKEYATFWECEGYPRAWGHGSKVKQLPQNVVPKEKSPMRDSMWFKSSTVIPRVPKSMDLVPNRGMCSEAMANYVVPDERKHQETVICSVPSPWTASAPGPEDIFSVPNMYKTEYGNYGSRKHITV